jgi:hypothetical protein
MHRSAGINAHDRLLHPLLAAGRPPSFTVDANGTTSPDITARAHGDPER